MLFNGLFRLADASAILECWRFFRNHTFLSEEKNILLFYWIGWWCTWFQKLHVCCFAVSGIEISDVLKIDDKDYSITFSLYFNVQWSEPRLNLSQEFFNSENITTDEQLVPGINSITRSQRGEKKKMDLLAPFLCFDRVELRAENFFVLISILWRFDWIFFRQNNNSKLLWDIFWKKDYSLKKVKSSF